ncbi:MAG: hypothetical protein PUK49_07775 [Oscillospiraceae bacterium]|nr:hypothetical protein [Oscillospiraceae bacterium]
MAKFTREEEALLRLFQTSKNRTAEESFSRIFTENPQVKLAFINENEAFTDGRNIVVDPAMDKLFSDESAVRNTLKFLGLPQESYSPWSTLKMSARSQNIHECLHIIFSKFPPPAAYDKRSTTRTRAAILGQIANIIEDAYIEAAGASIYDNAELFLKWRRVSHLFAASPAEGTVDRVLTKSKADMTSEGIRKISYILDHMAGELLYPMLEPPPIRKDCEDIIGKVRPLFFEGSAAPSPAERHEFACKIFDLIEDMIPDSDNDDDIAEIRKLEHKLGGAQTHSPFRRSAKNYVSEGKTQAVTRRLFTDLDGRKTDGADISEQYRLFVLDADAEYTIAYNESRSGDMVLLIGGNSYSAAPIHHNITIYENHPKPDINFARAYSNIVKKYSSVINSCNSRFDRLLKAETVTVEEKKLFGTGISSKYLGDAKKRYWYRKTTDLGVPEISVLLLIDGSGSMLGERRGAALVSSVILHEILSAQGIEHAVVEHRAIFGEPTLIHNVLIDINVKSDEKYNLMRLSANEGTREGLSLFWAERYLSSRSSAENKLIIAISDGVPAHICENNAYVPPVSVKDTANAVRKITRRGTEIIAVALGGEDGSCFDELKDIYPQTIDCADPKDLTGQLLKIIARRLKK